MINTIFRKNCIHLDFLQLENEIENEMVPGLVFSNRKVFFSSYGLVARTQILDYMLSEATED